MSDIQRISATEAEALLRGGAYLYLDVRGEAEYDAGHPAGALNVPFAGQADAAQFLATLQALYPVQQPLIVGCACGIRSQLAARSLSGAGFSQVLEMRPGFCGLRGPFGQLVEPGWQACGFAVEQQTPGASYPELSERAGL